MRFMNADFNPLTVPKQPTKTELDSNSAAKINSIVYDPGGDLGLEAFSAQRGDRILSVPECLFLSEMMITESWLADGRGSVLFIQPSSSTVAVMAASLLFDYAAQKIVARRFQSARLYPGGIPQGPFLRLLMRAEQSASAAVHAAA